MPMPAVAVVVTRWEQEGLARARRSRDGRLVRRAQVIELAQEGKPVSEIASLTGYSEEGVRLLKHRWNERREHALRDAPRSGRPPRWDAEYRRRLGEVVHRSPQQYGYAFQVWTIARLAEHMAAVTGVRVSPDRLRRILHELGLSWRATAHPKRAPVNPEGDERTRRRPADGSSVPRGTGREPHIKGTAERPLVVGPAPDAEASDLHRDALCDASLPSLGLSDSLI